MANASTSSARRKILFLAQFSVLLAIEAIVCFTPLGSLPALGPIAATLSHVPVILTAILLGPLAGSLMGFFFGLFSLLVWTFTPPFAPIAFVFTPFYSLGQFQGNLWSLAICFVPRILIGLVAGAVFALAKDRRTREFPVAAMGGALGSLANTFLVLGGIWLFFGRQYAEGAGFAYNAILGVIGATVLTSGLPEAAIGGFLAAAVAVPVRRIVFKAK